MHCIGPTFEHLTLKCRPFRVARIYAAISQAYSHAHQRSTYSSRKGFMKKENIYIHQKDTSVSTHLPIRSRYSSRRAVRHLHRVVHLSLQTTTHLRRNENKPTDELDDAERHGPLRRRMRPPRPSICERARSSLAEPDEDAAERSCEAAGSRARAPCRRDDRAQVEDDVVIFDRQAPNRVHSTDSLRALHGNDRDDGWCIRYRG